MIESETVQFMSNCFTIILIGYLLEFFFTLTGSSKVKNQEVLNLGRMNSMYESVHCPKVSKRICMILLLIVRGLAVKLIL